MKKYKVGVCGYFGGSETLLNGQTVKTKILTEELKRRFGAEKVFCVDSSRISRRAPKVLADSLYAGANCENIVFLPAQNGIRVFVPLFSFLKKLFGCKLHYAVVGGWLPEYIQERPALERKLKKLDCIYPETATMKDALCGRGFSNVVVMPNCKRLQSLTVEDLNGSIRENGQPLRLCTFSRVMEEKGIGDAVAAVERVNERFGSTVCTLDIFGQVEAGQEGWFDQLRSAFPEGVRYCGLIPFDRSVQTLKDYDMLLFPTWYKGEGHAGTLIDAYASGLPVISSDWKYNPEMVQPGVTGLLYPAKDAAALADRIASVVEDPSVLPGMREACLAESRNYSPERVIGILADRL